MGFPAWQPAAVLTLWLAAAGLLVATLATRARWRSAFSFLAVSCAAAGLAASVVSVQTPTRSPPILREASESHAAVRGTVTVLSALDDAPSFGGAATRIRFTGSLTELTLANRTHRVSVPVVVYADQPSSQADMSIGARIEVSGSIRIQAPGEATSARLFASEPPEPIAGAPWWLAWAADLRTQFSRAALTLPGDGGALLPGLAIGDTSSVGSDLDSAMKSSSLSHLTAVSGANCVIVTAAIMVLGAVLGLRRGLRITLALGALLGFVVLVTPEASVLRAAVMATIVMLAMGSGRPGRGLPALLLTVIALLIVDPWLSRSYGFALSALATAGLLVLSGPLTRALSRWMPTLLATAIAVPLAAQLACQPVLVLLAPSLPLYGVPANLVTAPAAPAATMVGLIGCLLLPWLPGLAGAFLQLAWLPSAWIAAVARTVAGLPASQLPWWGGLAGAALIALLTVLALVLLVGYPQRRPARWWASGLTVLLIFTGGYAGAVVGTGVGRALSFPRDWQVAACDVGQGDAVLLRDGEFHALIDVGREPAPLTRCLRDLGITRIDLLVLTHYDADHVGGVEAVIGMTDVALVGVPENPNDERIQHRLSAGGADVRPAASGDSGSLGAVRWRVLWPLRGSSLMQTGNDGSISMEFDGRGIRSLFLADLGEDSQRALDAAARPGQADVVKVAHHGSGDQRAELYQRVRAGVALISVGDNNGYGHPTNRLLNILRSAGTAAFRTDRQGMLVVAPGPAGAVTVWTERGG